MADSSRCAAPGTAFPLAKDWLPVHTAARGARWPAHMHMHMRGGQWGAVVLLMLTLLLAACGSSATAGPNLDATPTPGPKPEYLTYIGTDGNVWQLSLPAGSAIQLTDDARSGTVTYSGLAWSPDGKQLAVLRIARSGQTIVPQLVVLRPDGQIVLQTPLLAVPYGHAFAWSPNSNYIVYRILGSRTSSTQALLDMLDARSGALHKALTYPFQQGCGGTFTALHAAINRFHQADGGIDTFEWTPDANAVLVSAGCSNDSALRIDLNTGSVTPGYPRGATFQPGSNVLLGVWNGENDSPDLGLRDTDNDIVRELTTESVSSPERYPVVAGEAFWAATGSQVYYEHADGIWRIGADGSGARAVVVGTTLDNKHHATVELSPLLSPNGQMLVYCELTGTDTPAGSVSYAWYLAAPDGTNPAVLPDITTGAAWQPVA